MATTKDERIYIRVSSDIKDEFEKVAEYRGLKSSTLLHTLIVKTIHDAKEEKPQIFATDLNVSEQKPIKPKTPKAEKLNFSGTQTKSKKDKEQALIEEMDAAIEKRKTKK